LSYLTAETIQIDPDRRLESIMLAAGEIVMPQERVEGEEAEIIDSARSRMRNFTQYTFPGYKADVFHLHVSDYIDRVVFLDHPYHITHLMLNAPPQHGKSEIVSTRLPGYWLAHNPTLPVAMMSYNQRLSFRNSRNARDVFDSPSFGKLFTPTGIFKDKTKWRVKDWHLNGYKGFVFAAAMRGDFTGEGFGLGIIDDPIKDWADAQSDVIRENLWEWYNGTYKTRFWEGACQIFMMTRWHEDDLAGRALATEGNLNVCTQCGEYMPDDIKPERCPKCDGKRGKWKTLVYPALSENQEDRDARNKAYFMPEGLPDILGRAEGMPLAPSRYSKEFLEEVKFSDTTGLVWGAEYQQHPTPPKGAYFKIGRIEIVEMYPLDAFGGQLVNQIPFGVKNCIRFWDFAGTEEKTGNDPDWTVGGLLGIDPETNLTWVLHVVRVRAEPENIDEIVKTTAIQDGKKVKIRIEQEPGSSGKKVISYYTKFLKGYDVAGIPSDKNKVVRAYTFSIQVNAGNVRFVAGEWNTPVMATLRVFPFGRHDDDVDSLSGAFNETTEPDSRYRQKFKHL